MLERVLVKRLRDSDSDNESEEESSSTQSQRSSTDKPTDILTTDKPIEAQVHMIFNQVCVLDQILCNYLGSNGICKPVSRFILPHLSARLLVSHMEQYWLF